MFLLLTLYNSFNTEKDVFSWTLQCEINEVL